MKRSRLVFAFLMCALLACRSLPFGVSSPAPSPTLVPTLTSSPSPSPTVTMTSVLPSPTRLPVSTLSAELQATLSAGLPATSTPDGKGFAGFGGLEGVRVFPVQMQPLQTGPGEAPLWAVLSQGMRSYEPMQNHFVAIYTYDSEGWQELSRLELSEPDYMGESSLEQVQVEPGHTWLQATGGVGAHGGCFNLLSFDGQELQEVLSNCASSPDAGETRDLNGDGMQEVLLNWSENYVFCYACGVRIWLYQVWRWDGGQLVEVQLSRLPKPAPEGLSELNDRAVELAEAELWKDARETIRQAIALAPQDQTVAWNAALIELHARQRARLASDDGPYPLLAKVFYGDYAAALDSFRSHLLADLFNPATSLVKGTVAEGWEEALRDWILVFTGKALQAQPDLAAAYFLRGWAVYILNPQDRSAVADIQRAAELDPAEPLFSQCAAYLR